MIRRMTPVLGCEVTTPAGHFNIFPVEQRYRFADHALTDWPKLMQSIRDVRGVKVAILNHPRNKHTNFVPFADENFDYPVTLRLRALGHDVLTVQEAMPPR